MIFEPTPAELWIPEQVTAQLLTSYCKSLNCTLEVGMTTHITIYHNTAQYSIVIFFLHSCNMSIAVTNIAVYHIF